MAVPMEQRYKNLTILHSNDLHGDFLSENVDEKLLGGISMLSGYVSQVRASTPNTLYCIAGDMLQGSLIDTEFKGISTIEIMNIMNPDIVSLGNHEIDYGLSHLLFLERCAKFPIVCANLFIRNPYTRLFNSHKIIEMDGMRILFIGIITQEVLFNIRTDNLLSKLVDVEDAAKEVERICNAYRDIDIDFTVLLTHIGFAEDKALAALLDPEWGVDLIIGGHSHTVLEAPEEVNSIVIAQAGVGTSQIGRFDIVVDTDTNSISSYEWQLIPINSEHCPRDPQLEETITRFKQTVDDKYDSVLCRFPRVLTHPDRYRETELGNLLSDILEERLGVDLVLLGSGSIRKPKAGPVFTRRGLAEIFPYDDRGMAVKVTGGQLKRMLAYVLDDAMLDGGHGEFYQISRSLRLTYNRASRCIEQLEFNGKPVGDDDILRVALQDYHYKNFSDFFNVPVEELPDSKPTVLTTSIMDVLEEFLATTHQPSAQVDGRITVA
jgi:5'-nucleotidase